MFRDVERRDSFEARDRSLAARYAENTDLPQWVRDAWQAVADGRAASVADALHKGLRAAPQAAAVSSRKAPVTSDAARIEYLESKLAYMQEALKRERQHQRKLQTPEGKRAARAEMLVDKLLKEI